MQHAHYVQGYLQMEHDFDIQIDMQLQKLKLWAQRATTFENITVPHAPQQQRLELLDLFYKNREYRAHIMNELETVARSFHMTTVTANQQQLELEFLWNYQEYLVYLRHHYYLSRNLVHHYNSATATAVASTPGFRR